MEFYSKGLVVDTDDVADLPFDENCVHMKVTYGSKIRNLIGYALKKMQNSSVKQISWTGEGKAFSKVISCAQIFTSRIKGLHRMTDVRYHRVEEHWEPLMQGLEGLKVNRDIPAITVLLSKSPLQTDSNRSSVPVELQNLLKKALKESARNAESINDDPKRGRHKAEKTNEDMHRTRRSKHKNDVRNSEQESVASRTSHEERTLGQGHNKQKTQKQEGKERSGEKKSHHFTFKKKQTMTEQHAPDENTRQSQGKESSDNAQLGQLHSSDIKLDE